MDFTKNNDAIAKLLSISVPEDMDTVYVKNSKMSPLMKKEASILYEAIFGLPFEDDDFSLTLKAKDGEVTKIYGPSAGCVLDENDVPIAIGIKWGEQFATIPLKGSSLVKPQLEKGDNNAQFSRFEINEANFGFKDNEIAVCVDYETDTDYYTVAFPLRFQDNQNKPDLASFKTGLKKDAGTYLGLLYSVFEGRGGEGGGESINKLTELDGPVNIIDVVEYKFTTKKGEERESKLLVDTQGCKYWSADLLDVAIPVLLGQVKDDQGVQLSVLETQTSKSGKSKYVSLGELSINSGEHIQAFGSSIPTAKEKELPEGKYVVLGFESFNCQKDGKTFKSYVYIVQDEDNEIYKTFVPAKHRDTLGASADISYDNPGFFTVYVSGNDGDFTCSQLKCEHKASDFDFDTSDLF